MLDRPLKIGDWVRLDYTNELYPNLPTEVYQDELGRFRAKFKRKDGYLSNSILTLISAVEYCDPPTEYWFENAN